MLYNRTLVQGLMDIWGYWLSVVPVKGSSGDGSRILILRPAPGPSAFLIDRSADPHIGSAAFLIYINKMWSVSISQIT